MRENMETWKAIVLAIETFCMGGVLFGKSETTKNTLRVGMMLCALLLLATS